MLPQTCGLGGRHDLARARPGGALGRLLALAPIRDLECLDGDDALVLEGDWAGSGTRFLRVDEFGAARQLATWPDAVAVAGHANRVVLGTTTGDVVLFDASVGNGPPLARAALGSEIGDLAPAPGGGWWALVVAGGSSLVRLDDQLRVKWSTLLGGSVLDLAIVPGEELVWLPRSTEPWLLAVGDGGRKLTDLDLAAIGDVDRGDGFAGGCLLAAPGFILRVAGGGSTLMTQGGFDRVLDLSITPP